MQMFAITGITGQVGGVVALAEMHDMDTLRRAFEGAEGVFVLLPPVFDPSPDFSESRRNIAALREALGAAKPSRVAVLSTIGAQATQPNLLNQLGIMERELRTLPIPIVFLRAAWFFENSAWDV